MRIRTTRFFVSTVFGNVDAGRVLTVSDAQGMGLIDNGLAQEIPGSAPLSPLGVASNFIQPAATGPGVSSQAGQVSSKPIAKKSGTGKRRAGTSSRSTPVSV